ncbi:hypothetical protein [Streptomyces phaeoluteigriseus]
MKQRPHRQLESPRPGLADWALHAYPQWRGANSRHRYVLAAKRKDAPASAAGQGIR